MALLELMVRPDTEQGGKNKKKAIMRERDDITYVINKNKPYVREWP